MAAVRAKIEIYILQLLLISSDHHSLLYIFGINRGETIFNLQFCQNINIILIITI